jgi:hypothetical protein
MTQQKYICNQSYQTFFFINPFFFTVKLGHCKKPLVFGYLQNINVNSENQKTSKNEVLVWLAPRI